MSILTVKWMDYDFTVFQPNATTWNDIPGIYIFAKESQPGIWHALYIGQTTSFAERLHRHPRWPRAASLGATHVHALPIPEAAARMRLERALIRFARPALNHQDMP